MKQSDLIETLKKYLNKEMRKIVREEIKYSFNKDLRNIVREELELLGNADFTLNERGNELETTITTKEETHESLVPKKKKTRIPEDTKFSSNPMLNDILAETAVDARPISEQSGPSSGGYETMGNMMTSKDVVQNTPPDLNPGHQRSTGGTPDIREMVPQDRRGRDVPDFLQNILTRDWSNNPEVKKAAIKNKESSGLPPTKP